MPTTFDKVRPVPPGNLNLNDIVTQEVIHDLIRVKGQMETAINAAETTLAALNIPTEATSTQVLNETAGTYYVPPDLIVHSPRVMKGAALIDMTGTMNLVTSFNVTSVSDQGVGLAEITWNTDFASSSYYVSVSTDSAPTAGSTLYGAMVQSQAAGTCRVQVRNQSGTTYDADFVHMIAWGPQ